VKYDVTVTTTAIVATTLRVNARTATEARTKAAKSAFRKGGWELYGFPYARKTVEIAKVLMTKGDK
jgi:hypothetical protein